MLAALPPTTSLDITVSCPLLPSYLAAAAESSSSIFDQRHREKAAKHLAGCAELGRTYLSYVLTTQGGVGPPETLTFIDSIFIRSMAREIAAMGTGRDALERRDLLFASSHAALLRANSVCLCRHVAASPTGAAASPAAAKAAQLAMSRLTDEHRQVFEPPTPIPPPPSGL
jgi:hypothetical protein